jgi:type VII secretion protein EccB
MQTRRDLYQAHKLMMQRVGLALLQGEPDVAESPMRRLSVAAFAGAMVALLIAAVFGVLGLISPGGARGLDRGDTVIIEKETGTKYIYNTYTKQMLPVLNYASAKLALNASGQDPRVVSRKSLARFVRGPMIGIPGAPDSLPDPHHLVKKPWSVCVRNAPTVAGGTRSVTSLVAGKSVGGQSLSANQAVVVQTGSDSYVIWQNQRMHMTIPPSQASSVTRVTPAPVAQTWLDPVEQGPDFAAPAVKNRGASKTDIGPDARVGQVYRAQSGGGMTWYVLVDSGFARISETQGWLLLAEPETKNFAYGGRTAEPLTTDLATANSKSAPPLLDSRLPQTLPSFIPWDGSTPLCSVYAHTDQGSTSAQLSIGGTLPDVPPTTSGQGTAVDQVVLPPGGAALVGLLPGAGQLNAINSWYVVNDAGISFPLSSKDTATKLGYDTSAAAPIPKPVLALIPTGPTLDPKAAVKPVPAPRPGG